MKKEFNLQAIIPTMGFKVAHTNVSLPEIGDFKSYGYEWDFDVYLETKGENLQRPLCWTIQQKREFILSLIKGVNVERVSIVFYRCRENSMVLHKVIDGKQRLSTTISFLNDEFDIIVDGESYLYSELPQNVKNKIYYWTPTACIAYSNNGNRISDDDLIKWFNLINFAGTEQEVSHRDKLNNLLNK